MGSASPCDPAHPAPVKPRVLGTSATALPSRAAQGSRPEWLAPDHRGGPQRILIHPTPDPNLIPNLHAGIGEKQNSEATAGIQTHCPSQVCDLGCTSNCLPRILLLPWRWVSDRSSPSDGQAHSVTPLHGRSMADFRLTGNAPLPRLRLQVPLIRLRCPDSCSFSRSLRVL